jgi:hypothetical protein
VYSILFLTLFVLAYPTIRAKPNQGLAWLLRRVLPIPLLCVAAYLFWQKLERGYVPLLTDMNPLALISLMQGYAALWLVHIMTSTTWVLSSQNKSAWILLPWQKGSSKLMGLVWNAFLSVGCLLLIWVHVLVVALIIWSYSSYAARRAAKAAVRVG